MTFSMYHFYVERINEIDHVVGLIAALAFIFVNILLLVRTFRPAWMKITIWLMIGGFYATLYLLVARGGPGA